MCFPSLNLACSPDTEMGPFQLLQGWLYATARPGEELNLSFGPAWAL